MIDIYKKILEVYKNGSNAVLCTIVSTKGSTPLKPGAKMIVYSDHSSFGTVGGGHLEKLTIEKAKEIFSTRSPVLFDVELTNKDGSCCGGTAQVFIEMLNEKMKLHIFGGGHVSKALVRITKKLGFETTVIDDRPEIFSNWTEPSAKIVTQDFNDYLDEMTTDEFTFIVIVTYNHDIDWVILSQLVKRPWHYLGMMGSHSKIKTLTKRMDKLGVYKETISRINMPIGLEINAVTADEIALSISSKLVMEKNLLKTKLHKSK